MQRAINLTRLDPACNMARFYRLEAAPDLFGGVRLTRCWGRIGTDGQRLVIWFHDADAAASALRGWCEKKAGRVMP